MLRHLSTRYQIFVISHQPQLTSMGQQYFFTDAPIDSNPIYMIFIINTADLNFSYFENSDQVDMAWINPQFTFRRFDWIKAAWWS